MTRVLSIDLSKDCVSPVFPAPNPAARGRKDQKSRLSADNLNAGAKLRNPVWSIQAGMNRRDFITLVGAGMALPSGLAWPVAAFAAGSDKNLSHFLGFHPVAARPVPGRVPGGNARAWLCRGQER